MRAISLIGILLILLGIAFVIVPILANNIDLNDIPSWLVFVYERGNFYFATSPIIIIISVIVFVLRFLTN